MDGMRIRGCLMIGALRGVLGRVGGRYSGGSEVVDFMEGGGVMDVTERILGWASFAWDLLEAVLQYHCCCFGVAVRELCVNMVS